MSLLDGGDALIDDSLETARGLWRELPQQRDGIVVGHLRDAPCGSDAVCVRRGGTGQHDGGPRLLERLPDTRTSLFGQGRLDDGQGRRITRLEHRFSRAQALCRIGRQQRHGAESGLHRVSQPVVEAHHAGIGRDRYRARGASLEALPGLVLVEHAARTGKKPPVRQRFQHGNTHGRGRPCNLRDGSLGFGKAVRLEALKRRTEALRHGRGQCRQAQQPGQQKRTEKGAKRHQGIRTRRNRWRKARAT